MKSKYGEKLELKIQNMDSEEAKGYLFRGSTMVLFEKEMVPLEIALDKNKMDAYLAEKI